MSRTHFLYHVIFATKDRRPLIEREWQSELYAYLGVVKNLAGVPLAVNGMADHVHLLVRLPHKIAFSDFMRELKASSSKWVRRHHSSEFAWQSRYGAFTVSESQVDRVRRYIRNQQTHHGKKSFGDEYVEILEAHGIEFDRDYLWS
jgi:putative transposase